MAQGGWLKSSHGSQIYKELECVVTSHSMATVYTLIPTQVAVTQ